MAGPPAASGIAVLPFESLSSDKGNAFFADGVYDGVSTKLAKVANLKVISHNSVAKYRGARNTQEIGRALNVAYVLEGSVRREAGRIHLNAQLIDTRTDAHVWAQEYDRNLNDVFTLQRNWQRLRIGSGRGHRPKKKQPSSANSGSCCLRLLSASQRSH
jgi:TolB-like protein